VGWVVRTTHIDNAFVDNTMGASMVVASHLIGGSGDEVEKMTPPRG